MPYMGNFCKFRFGYDYSGGYDREVGGRQGYADDRPHGRFRSGGFPGGPSGNYLLLGF